MSLFKYVDLQTIIYASLFLIFGVTALYLWMRARRRDDDWRRREIEMKAAERQLQYERDNELRANQKVLLTELENRLNKQQEQFRHESERHEKERLDIDDARVGSGGYIVVEMRKRIVLFFTIS
jgi:hypothetical protein